MTTEPIRISRPRLFVFIAGWIVLALGALIPQLVLVAVGLFLAGVIVATVEWVDRSRERAGGPMENPRRPKGT